ncbi:hypothetical protein H0H81_008233 [Sphagnurus paluster]|uniref:Spc7 kinetochore protein domain-containing protein n=1 Tax=Sphagnurus paluster TaxID=117069 RepID=A0A9P7KKB3_9AGAR|nr:hypothetical protein H0H81_008233 [Sphagnurus paluster]
MDITREFHTRIHDNTTRKSFGGRRVSFAENVRVRLIEGINKDNTNGTQSPQSSPVPETAPEPPSRPPADENDYPGAPSGSRRRSSARYSLPYGEDMDMTSVMGGSDIVDEEFDHIEHDDAMDMTEVIQGDLVRKRSLSIGGRPPLAQLPQLEAEPPTDDQDLSQSFEESGSQLLSDAASDDGQPMDFTMPLSRSKRPPVEHDALWHALRQATHSGDTPIEPEPSSDDLDHGAVPNDGMDLDAAVQRLMRARLSLPAIPAIPDDDVQMNDDDTFSTQNSFEDQGNHTMNLSTVYGRASSSEAAGSRVSIGSAMDESEIYGAIAAPSQSAPRLSLAPPPLQQPKLISQLPSPVPQPPTSAPQPPAPVSQPPSPVSETPASGSQPPAPVSQPPTLAFTVFHPPPSTSTSKILTSNADLPRKELSAPVFTPKPQQSPSKSKGGAPAPPSPSKLKRPEFSAAFAPLTARSSPSKRPRPPADVGRDDFDSDKPSPAKRLAVAGINASSPAAPSLKVKPKPLSPSKKAPFQVFTASSQRTSSSLRRPSGYFAKRKSLGAGLGSQRSEDDSLPVGASTSPKKKVGLGLGRASMGSGSQDAWQRFDLDTETGMDKGTTHCGREAARQAGASPTITRGSPAPASPRPAPASLVEVPPFPSPQTINLSALPIQDNYEGNDLGEESMELDPTEQWRNAVESPSEFVQPEHPPISIKEFFSMTGIKFMDELTAPRRSTHPSQQAVTQPRKPEEVSLAEYVVAMGMDIPELVLYSRVSKDLQAWIEKSKADFAQAEDEAAKITPELFTEYSRADEEGQAELLHQLQLIRTNTRALAKSDWYDWKLQWLEGLRVTAEQTFKSLEADAKSLENIKASSGDIIPALKKEYDEVMAELERETAEVAEIEACDQEYLNELKASIAEQNIEVEALQAEVAESKAKLLALQERLEETNSQKQEAKIAIADAQSVLHIQKNGTRAEVFRLKDELESLEDLHMFRATKVNAEMFEYIYGGKFSVSIPCKNFVPIVRQVDVTRVDKLRTAKDNFPRLSDLILQMAKEQIVRGENRTTRQIVHRLSDYWSSCAQLRAQLKLLTIKFPVEIEIVQGSRDDPPSFKAKVMVLFPSVKAKAFVSFVFSPKTLCYWPVTISTLRCEVEVIYGNVDRDIIVNAVADRLSQAGPEENYACLLDACIEAQEIYH